MPVYADHMKMKPVTYEEVKKMGAFKKATVAHFNDDDQTYFFSTDHCQDTNEAFVPVTYYTMTMDEVREEHVDTIYKEIDNPDPDFRP